MSWPHLFQRWIALFIHWINLKRRDGKLLLLEISESLKNKRLLDSVIGFPNTYPPDSDLSGGSAIQLLNNRGLGYVKKEVLRVCAWSVQDYFPKNANLIFFVKIRKARKASGAQSLEGCVHTFTG